MSHNLEVRLERLRRKLELAIDPEDRLDLEASITAIEAQLRGLITINNTQAGDITLGDVAGRDLLKVGWIGHVFINGNRGQDRAELLGAYLQRVIQRCTTLPLQGVHEQRADADVLRINVEQIYTQLATTYVVPRELIKGALLANVETARSFLARSTSDNALPAERRLDVRIREQSGTPIRTNIHSIDGYAQPLHLPYAEQHDRSDGSEAFILADMPPQQLARLARNSENLEFSGPQLITEAIAAERCLVLLGEPGSGKSTVLRYLALLLARAGLDATYDLREALAGWADLADQGHLLPLLMPLYPFAGSVPDEHAKPADAADLWNYIRKRVEAGDRYPGLGEAIHRELEEGHVLLLLDGLDEVGDEATRRQIARAVRAFADEYRRCRIVVTCRVRAYVGDQNHDWRLAEWPTATLADWTPAQMRHFATAWYAAAAAASQMSNARRDERAASLRRAITLRPDLQRIGVRPLLMTIMALVHFNTQGQLPEKRTTLYNRCVDVLLGQWELAREDGNEFRTLMHFIELPEQDIQTLRPLLQQIAFQAHNTSNANTPGSMSAAMLRDLVAAFLEKHHKHPNPYYGARKFLEYTDKRAGLLQASDAGDAYGFPHLTFQEYLAARELVSGIGVVERIWAYRTDDHWRLPIILGVSDHVIDGKLEMPLRLLLRLIHEKGREPAQLGRDLLLAAEIAEDVGWANLERGGEEFKLLREALADTLAQFISSAAQPAAERVQAGAALGVIGDLRPGVRQVPPPMIPIAGGSFVIGSSREEAAAANAFYGFDVASREINDQPVIIADFAMAQYPITNVQFQQFIDADGYNPDAPWWRLESISPTGRSSASADAQVWMRMEQIHAPRYWEDPNYGKARPNHPVVGVSWYEAVAFCAWLTSHLNDEYIYVLPSEAEWEYVARGTARRAYPWGSPEPDAERANCNDFFGGPTAVGCFAASATPEGVQDLAGNVWEWTRSVYAPYPYDPTDGREDGSNPARKRFTVRGGAWSGLPVGLRAASRDDNPPDFRYALIGFRVIRRPRHAAEAPSIL